MKKKIIFVMIMICGLSFCPNLKADTASAELLSSKLDGIEKKQGEILQKLSDLERQLEIVKIRASHR